MSRSEDWLLHAKYMAENETKIQEGIGSSITNSLGLSACTSSSKKKGMGNYCEEKLNESLTRARKDGLIVTNALGKAAYVDDVKSAIQKKNRPISFQEVQYLLSPDGACEPLCPICLKEETGHLISFIKRKNKREFQIEVGEAKLTVENHEILRQVVFPNCRHQFCHSCAYVWMQRSGECP